MKFWIDLYDEGVIMLVSGDVNSDKVVIINFLVNVF